MSDTHLLSLVRRSAGRFLGQLGAIGLAAMILGSQTACSATSPSVQLIAQRADLASLVGEWVGEYSSAESGRSGSIVFKLAAGADSATGDVVMTPRGSGEPLSANAPPGGGAVRPASQPLRIRFVRLESGAVSGTLEPYRDPELGILLNTVFTGTLDGDQIRGTFTTSGAELPRAQHGEWHATRRSSR